MRPPPSRYKVVERGRRLEVIDTRTGEPARPAIPLPPGGRASPRRDLAAPPASGRGAGGAGIDSGSFTTRGWYDDKAPRTIRLDPVARAQLLNLRWGIALAAVLFAAVSFWFWPFALFLLLALLSGSKLRAQLRAASTRYIDGLDQAARVSSSSG